MDVGFSSLRISPAVERKQWGTNKIWRFYGREKEVSSNSLLKALWAQIIIYVCEPGYARLP